MLNVYTGKSWLVVIVYTKRSSSLIGLCRAQGNSPNDLSQVQTPDRAIEDVFDGQDTPLSIDRNHEGGLNPDSESLERRLLEHQNGEEPQSSDVEASSLIKLDNGDVLYMREVNRYIYTVLLRECEVILTQFLNDNRLLVLICLLRQDNFEKHGLIDYNFQCFKEAVTEVFEFSRKRNTQQQQ